MKHRLLSIFASLLCLGCVHSLGAEPNLYIASFFSHESITSTSTHGGKLTMGFGSDNLYGTTSVRVQSPKTNLHGAVTKRIHGSGSPLDGMLLGTLDYFSYGEQNGATSLIVAYALQANSQSRIFPSLLRVSMGVHGTNSWSASYDTNLVHLAPYVAVTVAQALYDRIFVNLFLTTDPPSLQESDFSFCYGGSLALVLNDNLTVVVKPLVRLSDFSNESLFVTMQEISYSICWTEASARKRTLPALGVWI